MKSYQWNKTKNEELKRTRDVSFEQVIIALAKGYLLDIVKHPNEKRYTNQNIFIIDINNYAYLVPFVEDDNIIFLKTIIPSRKATRKYLR